MSFQIDLTPEQIRARLSGEMSTETNQFHLEFPQLLDILPDEAKPAAVLIPLQCIRGKWHVLFTRRNAKLLEHSGQVAFPGGRSDPEDPDPETTAIRETWEEIGIKPSDIEVLGRLPSLLTITNYLVTPIVGNIPYPYIYHPAIDEVSRIFTIPLDWLADPKNHEVRQRVLPAPFDPVSVIYFHEYDGEVLWGASARFTMSLLKILCQVE